MKKVIITSGFFNPLHIGHINLIREAKKLGDFLVVVVNNDKQVEIKGSFPFMPEQERIEIIRSLRYADDVILSVDKDGTVAKSIESIAKKYPGVKLFFAKGGDRNSGNIPENETKVCQEFNVEIINGVGGGKIQSSSWLLKNAATNNNNIDFSEKTRKFYRKIFPGIASHLKKDLLGCESVLDLGCGLNSPLQYCEVPLKTGVDLFGPYLDQSKKKGIHNEYIEKDITKVEFKPKSFDAVMAFEVLEHLSKEEGLELLKKMERWARKKVIVTTPNGFTEQDEYDANPLQIHKSGWTAKEFEEKGFKVFGMNGPKNLRGHKGRIKYKPAALWLIISELAQKAIYYYPGSAFHLYAIKNIK